VPKFETLTYSEILGAAMRCNSDNGHHLPLNAVKRLAQRLHDMQTGVLDATDPKVIEAAFRQSDRTARAAVRKVDNRAAGARRLGLVAA
jgi:hypothetical protein